MCGRRQGEPWGYCVSQDLTKLIAGYAGPEEVAGLVAYVASPLSSSTNGAALRVDGGVVPSIA